MVNICDKNAAAQIIAFERRAYGWDSEGGNVEWEEGIRQEIAGIQNAVQKRMPIETASGDGSIYGQWGVNRYQIDHDGEITFLSDLCDIISRDKAGKIAKELGFRIK